MKFLKAVRKGSLFLFGRRVVLAQGAQKKYIVAGDALESCEGEVQYIDSMELCRLYGIHPSEAILVERRQPSYRHVIRSHPDLPVLRPRPDGDYSLEESSDSSGE